MPDNSSTGLLSTDMAGNVDVVVVLQSCEAVCFWAACLVVDGLLCGLWVFFFLHLGLTGVSSSRPSVRVRESIVCLLLLTVLVVGIGAVMPNVSCLDSLRVLGFFP